MPTKPTQSRSLAWQSLALPVPSGILVVLLFFLPLAYWPTLFLGASLPRHLLIHGFVAITLLTWALTAKRFNAMPKELLLAFTVFAWASITSLWSNNPQTSYNELIHFANYLLLAFLASQLFNLQISVRFVVPAILIGALLAVITGLFQYLQLDLLKLRHSPGQYPATFINKNHAANYFDFIPALALFGILIFRKRAFSLLAAAAFALILAYIVINPSRGSQLALTTSILLLLTFLIISPCFRQSFIKRSSQRKPEWVLAVILFSGILLAPSPPKNQLDDDFISRYMGQDHSSQLRLAMYANSLATIADHPLTGIGYGNFRIGFEPYASTFLPTDLRTEDVFLQNLHNDPLQFIVELGLPAGLLVLLIFLMVMRRAWRFLRTVRAPEPHRYLVLALMLGLSASGTHALVDFPMRLPASAAMFWLYIGWLLYLTNNSSSRKLFYHSLSIRGIAGLTALSLIALLVTIYPSRLAANHALYQGAFYLQKEQCLPAASAARRGLTKYPYDFMLETLMAQIITACSFPPETKLAVVNQLLELDPTIHRARLARAYLFLDRGDQSAAREDFIHIIQVLPHRATAYAGLGELYEKQGKIEQAKELYRAAIKREPDYRFAIKRLRTLENFRKLN